MDAITSTERRLAVTAIAGSAAFAAVAVVLPVVQGSSYHPAREAIDDLTVGSGGWAIQAGFGAAALATVALAVLLRRTIHRAAVGPALLGVAGILRLVLAVTRHIPDGRTQTTASSVHAAAGGLSMVVTIMAMFALVRAMGRDASWRRYKRTQLAWSVAALAVVIVLSPPVVGEAHFGVAQRVGEAVLFAWTVAMAARPLVASDTTEVAAARLTAAAR
ncbi:MAG TPA: DUF998 domain-containing protein [Acidimicrobiales bacterium]|nr:DUF998 domain-containing protein [Acidimicrobiales bacterium]